MKMSNSIQTKIDFAVVFKITRANPNGDPLNGNRPRQTYDGFGEISDVCLKRKIRNRLQNGVTVNEIESKECIFVQSDELKNDDSKSLKDRYDKANITETDKDKIINVVCKKWFDVRAFGHVFAYKKKGAKKSKKISDVTSDETSSDGADSVSIGVRGPVTIQSAFSLEPITITSNQITKSVSGETTADVKKASDTMGQKHRVDNAYYATYGSISCQLAEKTGFSADDALKVKEALRTLFRDDASSARPDGSMEVVKVVWITHTGSKHGKYPSAKVHRSIEIKTDGTCTLNKLQDLNYEEIDGE
jgi:CRISPR-associated protein Csd2